MFMSKLIENFLVDDASKIFYNDLKNAYFFLILYFFLWRAWNRQNILSLLTRPKNNFESNQMSFSSCLGTVFQLPEFQTKLFFKRSCEWVVLTETAS